MPTLPKVQSELNITSNMKKIMEVMKGIALSGFVDIKNKREKRFIRFTRSFDSFFHLSDLTKRKSPFVDSDSPTIGVLAITSNEAFMAGLNNKILRKALDITEGRDRHIMITGPRMKGKLKSEEIEFKEFPPVRESSMYEVAVEIKDYVIDMIKNHKIGKFIAVFADPVSLSTQEIRPITMLPAHHTYPQEMNVGVDETQTIHLESNIDEMMEFMSELWMVHKLIELFQDNRMSEGAAQAMQLNGNLENLKEMEKKLMLLFRKTRREIIDNALRETVGSMLAAEG